MYYNEGNDGHNPDSKNFGNPGVGNEVGVGHHSNAHNSHSNDAQDSVHSSNQDSSVGDDSNDDSTDAGSSTHICTATYNNGFITDKHFRRLKRYGVNLRKTDPDLMRAYDLIGPIIANSLSNKYIGVFLTKYYEAKYNKSKLTLMQSVADVAATTIIRPTYRLIGKILKMKKGN